jgi:hypothetical protein
MQNHIKSFTAFLIVLVVGVGMGFLWFGNNRSSSASADSAISAPIVNSPLSSEISGAFIKDIKLSLLSAIDSVASDANTYTLCKVDSVQFNDAFAKIMAEQNSMTLFNNDCTRSKSITGEVVISLFSTSTDFLHDLITGSAAFRGKLNQALTDSAGSVINSSSINTSFIYQKEREAMTEVSVMPDLQVKRCDRISLTVNVGSVNPRYNNSICQK